VELTGAVAHHLDQVCKVKQPVGLYLKARKEMF